MAVTRIIPVHQNKGKSILRCLKERIDYAMNPEKTEQGELISSYACDPDTAAQEFALARAEYIAITGRRIPSEVIAYHLIQSFKPGEVTAEEANKIGNETAQRFLKGQHAFIVATHDNCAHIHNHLVFCAVALDCEHKFQNIFNSYKALEEVSDQVCKEHRLSVIEEPQQKSVPYVKWLGDNVKPNHRERLCMLIDAALQKSPQGFDALMQLLEDAGYSIKRGKHISLKGLDDQRYMRLDSLGPAYSEQNLRKTLAGKQQHNPRRYRGNFSKMQATIGRMIDLHSQQNKKKGRGFHIWAGRTNTQLIARSMVYLKKHNLDPAGLERKIRDLNQKKADCQECISAIDIRMNELSATRKVITDYRRTKDVYVQYRESGWANSFYLAHKTQIDVHMQAKKEYDASGGKMPMLKQIAAEFEDLKKKKQAEREKMKATSIELHEALNVRSNVETMLRPKHLDHEQKTAQNR